MSAIQIRKKLGLTQTEFWGRVGISQTAGSRYEGGRNIPEPVRMLLELAHGKRPLANLAKLRGCTPADITK